LSLADKPPAVVEAEAVPLGVPFGTAEGIIVALKTVFYTQEKVSATGYKSKSSQSVATWGRA
jgi:hypothetical protein